MGVTGARATVGDTAATLVARACGATRPAGLRRARASPTATRPPRSPASPTGSSSARRSSAAVRAPTARPGSPARSPGPGRGARRRRPAPGGAARLVTVPGVDPQPHPRGRGTSVRCRSGPTRCASSPASSSRVWLTDRRGAPRRRPGRHGRHRRLGGAVRHRRRPALPRDHRPRAVLRRRRQPARRASRSGTAASASGAPSRSARSGAWIGCRRRGIPLPAFADAIAPGIVSRRPSAGWATGSTTSSTAAPTDAAVGAEDLRVGRRRTGAARQPDGSPGAPPVDFHPTFLYELLWDLLVALLVVWADRRFRLGHGRAFALYVAGYTRRPAVDRAAAHTTPAVHVSSARPDQRLHRDRLRRGLVVPSGSAGAAGGPAPASRVRPGRPEATVARDVHDPTTDRPDDGGPGSRTARRPAHRPASAPGTRARATRPADPPQAETSSSRPRPPAGSPRPLLRRVCTLRVGPAGASRSGRHVGPGQPPAGRRVRPTRPATALRLASPAPRRAGPSRRPVLPPHPRPIRRRERHARTPAEATAVPFSAGARAASGLYDPANDHDACGVGLRRRHQGPPQPRDRRRRRCTALHNLDHRGAAGAEPN